MDDLIIKGTKKENEDLTIRNIALDDAIYKLKEENKTLKDKIEFLTKCLDDRDKSIDLMQKQEYPFGPVKTISEPTNGR